MPYEKGWGPTPRKGMPFTASEYRFEFSAIPGRDRLSDPWLAFHRAAEALAEALHDEGYRLHYMGGGSGDAVSGS